MVDLASVASRVADAAPDWRGGVRALRRVTRRASVPLTPEWWGAVGLASLAICVTAGLLAVVLAPAEDPSRSAAETTASLPGADPSVWSPVVRPQTFFVLDLAGLVLDKPAMEVRRHAGGGREDIFTTSAGDGRGLSARVVAYRFGSEVRPAATFFLDIARRTAQAGLAVTRTTVPAPVATRLGAADVAEVTMTDGSARLACVAWRILRDDVDLRVTGWLCGADGRVPERNAVSCVVDRLDLAAAVSERDLRKAFQTPARGRDAACATLRTPPRRAA